MLLPLAVHGPASLSLSQTVPVPHSALPSPRLQAGVQAPLEQIWQQQHQPLQHQQQPHWQQQHLHQQQQQTDWLHIALMHHSSHAAGPPHAQPREEEHRLVLPSRVVSHAAAPPPAGMRGPQASAQMLAPNGLTVADAMPPSDATLLPGGAAFDCPSYAVASGAAAAGMLLTLPSDLSATSVQQLGHLLLSHPSQQLGSGRFDQQFDPAAWVTGSGRVQDPALLGSYEAAGTASHYHAAGNYEAAGAAAGKDPSAGRPASPPPAESPEAEHSPPPAKAARRRTRSSARGVRRPAKAPAGGGVKRGAQRALASAPAAAGAAGEGRGGLGEEGAQAAGAAEPPRSSQFRGVTR